MAARVPLQIAPYDADWPSGLCHRARPHRRDSGLARTAHRPSLLDGCTWIGREAGYLRDHPDTRHDYERLKRDLARRYEAGELVTPDD
jgi:hypothetical protein